MQCFRGGSVQRQWERLDQCIIVTPAVSYLLRTCSKYRFPVFCHLRSTESESPGCCVVTAFNEFLADSHVASLCQPSDLHLETTVVDGISRALLAQESQDSVAWTLGRSDLAKENSLIPHVLSTDWMPTIGNKTVKKKAQSCGYGLSLSKDNLTSGEDRQKSTPTTTIIL